MTTVRHRMHPIAPFTSALRHRRLIGALAGREIVARYRGSAIGMGWSLAQPLAMLAIYTFAFGVVYGAKWPGGAGTQAEFALAVFVGLLAIGLFGDCVVRAPALVVGNPNYVKRVVFPLESLAWVALAAAAFQCGIGLVAWCVVHAVLIGPPPATALLAPVLLAPVALTGLGVAWALAALAVYVRDVAHIVPLAMAALTFASPVFFPLAAVPQPYRAVAELNPVAAPVEMAREALMSGKAPALLAVLWAFAVAIVVAWFGFALFQRLRRGFADAL